MIINVIINVSIMCMCVVHVKYYIHALIIYMYTYKN
jgi:hypothetical protein